MITWEYMAGMIDADGCINTTKTGKYRNVVGRIIIANTNQEFLYALKAEFGGTVSIREKGAKEGWKPYGSIAWTNRAAEHILENVLPFLIIKKRQAELCLELIRMRNLPKNERYAYSLSSNDVPNKKMILTLNPEVREREQEIGSLIRELNKKGVPVNA